MRSARTSQQQRPIVESHNLKSAIERLTKFADESFETDILRDVVMLDLERLLEREFEAGEFEGLEQFFNKPSACSNKRIAWAQSQGHAPSELERCGSGGQGVGVS